MNTLILVFAIGFLFGASSIFIVMFLWKKDAVKREKELAESFLKSELANFSLAAIQSGTENLVKQNEYVLKHERELSSRELSKVTEGLTNLMNIVKDLEKDRVQKFGELSNALHMSQKGTENLSKLTHQLHSVIYQKQARGQWGERMAEDILRIAGFQEGINYKKQQTVTGGFRPDYTFMLPKSFTVNMDVKFPLENYSKYVNEEDKSSKERFMTQFINDVRTHLKAVAKKDYISIEDNTLDYIIIFIPSDIIYQAIFQFQPAIMDEALNMKVVMCSPSTLYAVLSVIRQSVDNYNINKSTAEILKIMDTFITQWNSYVDKAAVVAKRIESLQKDYSELMGVRTQKLEKPLNQFKELIQGKDDEEEYEEVY